MLISEVIKQLETLKEKHGNIDVAVTEESWGTCPATEICLSEYYVGGLGWHPAILIT
jgi:hypothetical protein